MQCRRVQDRIQLEEVIQPVREEQPQQNESVFRWFIHEAHDRLYGDTNPEDAVAVVKILYSEGPVIVCCKPQDLKRAKDFAACCIDLETERKTVKPKILKEEELNHIEVPCQKAKKNLYFR